MLAMQKTMADSCDAGNTERAAQRRLKQCGYDALKHIACRFHSGAMTLSGTVPMYFHKQLAQEAVRDLRNVDVIVNDIEVAPW